MDICNGWKLQATERSNDMKSFRQKITRSTQIYLNERKNASNDEERSAGPRMGRQGQLEKICILGTGSGNEHYKPVYI